MGTEATKILWVFPCILHVREQLDGALPVARTAPGGMHGILQEQGGGCAWNPGRWATYGYMGLKNIDEWGVAIHSIMDF